MGSALVELLGDRAEGVSRERADLANPASVERFLSDLPGGVGKTPYAIVNAAAYTQVDRAEADAETARAVNAESPAVMAKWAAAYGVPLISYSTDYVFPGLGSAPHTEESPTGPLNVYGRTKLDGEKAIADCGGRWLVFRTCWVYDSARKNFFTTMLRLGKEKETLKVVSDQIGAPTYAPDLARATLQALDRALKASSFPSGVYHLCHRGETSWHGFATAIFAKLRRYPEMAARLRVRSVDPIPTQEYPTPAQRPLNSRLSTALAERVFGVSLPPWEEGLDSCIEELHASHRS